MDRTECQVHTIATMHEPLSPLDTAWQFRNRLRRFIKRRIAYLVNITSHSAAQATEAPTTATEAAEALQAGDRVRVKSKAEIRATLDDWNELKGCGFMDEMWDYCDTEQTVFKRVDQFLDERDYRVKRVKSTLLLEGSLCPGTVDFGRCDRSCYFFWREEWLEKV